MCDGIICVTSKVLLWCSPNKNYQVSSACGCSPCTLSLTDYSGVLGTYPSLILSSDWILFSVQLKVQAPIAVHLASPFLCRPVYFFMKFSVLRLEEPYAYAWEPRCLRPVCKPACRSIPRFLSRFQRAFLISVPRPLTDFSPSQHLRNLTVKTITNPGPGHGDHHLAHISKQNLRLEILYHLSPCSWAE